MRRLLLLRVLRAVTAAIFVSLLIIDMFVRSPEIRVISLVFLMILLVLIILQIYYLLRLRRAMKRWREQNMDSWGYSI